MNYEVWLTYKDYLYNLFVGRNYYKLTYEGLCFKIDLEKVGRSEPLLYIRPKCSNEILEFDIDRLNFDDWPKWIRGPLESFLELYFEADKVLSSSNIKDLYSLNVEDIEIQKV